MPLGRVLALVVALIGIAPAMAQSPQRVVTVNLCLDQMALRLAAPGQLVGVSWLSHDPRMAVLADKARAVPAVRAQVESILDLRPDMVVFDEGGFVVLKRLLRQAGVRVFTVPFASSLDSTEVLVGKMAEALGRAEAGARVIADMRAERQRLAFVGEPTLRAAVLQANGRTAGKGSLTDELLRLAGYRNLAVDIGLGSFGRLPLETVVANQPDVLVFDRELNTAAPSHATEFVDHRALRLLAHARQVSLPLRYTICGGPENLEAVRLLAEARR